MRVKRDKSPLILPPTPDAIIWGSQLRWEGSHEGACSLPPNDTHTGDLRVVITHIEWCVSRHHIKPKSRQAVRQALRWEVMPTEERMELAGFHA